MNFQSWDPYFFSLHDLFYDLALNSWYQEDQKINFFTWQKTHSESIFYDHSNETNRRLVAQAVSELWASKVDTPIFAVCRISFYDLALNSWYQEDQKINFVTWQKTHSESIFRDLSNGTNPRFVAQAVSELQAFKVDVPFSHFEATLLNGLWNGKRRFLGRFPTDFFRFCFNVFPKHPSK